MLACFDPFRVSTFGRPSVGPSSSRLSTSVPIAFWTSSGSVFHHASNSSVYSTSHMKVFHIIDIRQVEYQVRSATMYKNPPCGGGFLGGGLGVARYPAAAAGSVLGPSLRSLAA